MSVDAELAAGGTSGEKQPAFGRASVGDLASPPFRLAFACRGLSVSKAAPILQMEDREARDSLSAQAGWSCGLSLWAH